MIEQPPYGPLFVQHRQRIAELLWHLKGALMRHAGRFECDPSDRRVVDELKRVGDDLARIIAELDQGETRA